MTARAAWLAVAVVAAVAAVAPRDARADDANARSHFRQGLAFFRAGDYDRAISEYQLSYDLSPQPDLIFDIALCHDRAGRPEQALQSYRRYLELAPDGRVAEEAREDIARLTPIVDKLAADRAAEEARRREEAARQAELARPRPTPRDHPSRASRYIVVAGAALAAAGATTHVLAWRTRDRMIHAPDPESYFGDRDTFVLERKLAIGAYAAGALTVAAGLILGGTVLRTGDGPQLSAALTPGGAAVTMAWSR